MKSLPIFALLLISLAFAASHPCHAADADWMTDYKAALARGKKESKLVLLDFTGSDWCGWCIKLDREVFETREFKDYAANNLVLVQVDFPRAKQQPEALRRQNMELQHEFNIQGYPTLILVNGDGKKVGELGYMPGGPRPMIAALDKIRTGKQ